MTDLSYLLTEANLISSSSSKIRKFAQDAAKELAAQDARIAALEAKATTPPATPTPTPSAATPVPVGAVLFQEDFTGPLDLTKWDVKNKTNSYSGTTFVPGNVSVHDGLLDIVATKDATGKWYGGEIQSLAPAHQYSGPRYMEARAKLPVGQGTWPAPLWEWDAPWGSLGIENDVCEQLGKEPSVYHATVHDGPGTDRESGHPITAPVPLAGGDFHTYGCAMYADHADYYLDGKLTLTIKASEVPGWRFTTTPMVCLIDLDMGGSWAGTPTIPGPVHMLVDYVRVWALA